MLQKPKTIKRILTKWAVFCLFFCIILAVILLSKPAVFAAFVPPTAFPPDDNMPGYVTIGGESQARSGKLLIGSKDLPTGSYQLEVKGAGGSITDVAVSNDLMVDTDTLYVDSVKNMVGIGTVTPSEKLTVQGSAVINNTATGAGLSAWGDVVNTGSSHTIYGKTAAINQAGVAGVSTAADGYGVYAYNLSGLAIKGENSQNARSAIYGESVNGTAIYGANDSPQAQWAATFSGRLESSDDVSGAKFLAKKPSTALIPFTAGQVAASYPFTNLVSEYFDGTYIWGAGAGTDTLYKVRASDGFQIFAKDVDTARAGEITAITFDGTNLWVTVDGDVDNLLKIDPASGSVLCALGRNATGGGTTYNNFDSPRSVAFDGTFLWALNRPGANPQKGELVKVNTSCQQQSVVTLTDGTSGHEVDFSYGKVVYNGSYFIVTGRDSGSTNTDKGVIFNINPSTGRAVGWIDVVGYNPTDIFFDNYYYWTANKGTAGHADNSITRFYLGQKVCTLPSYDPNNERSCTVDSDCDSTPGAGDGACFAKATNFGTYTTPDASEPEHLAFDGMYLWVANDSSAAGEYGVIRLLAADPAQQERMMDTRPVIGLAFDGTYLWAGLNGTDVKKIYSGTGYGSTDLSGTLTLQQNSPLTQQSGSISIAGSGRTGGTLTAGGDLVAPSNVWGAEVTGDVIEGSFDDTTWTETAALNDGNQAIAAYALTEAPDGNIVVSVDKTPATLALLFRSNNQGQSWSSASISSSADRVYDVFRSGSNLFANSGIMGNIYRSADNGATWSTVFTSTYAAIRSSFQSSNENLFVGTQSLSGNATRIVRSTNGGATWPDVYTFGDSTHPAQIIYSFTQAADGRIFAGAQGGQMFSSPASGDNWTWWAVLPSGGDVRTLLKANNNSLYAGTAGGKIYRSLDNGVTWGETTLTGGATVVYSLTQASNGRLYAGADGGRIYSSTDNGDNWSLVATLSPAGDVYDLLQSSNGTLYAAETTGSVGRVFRAGFSPLPPGTYNCPDGHFIKNISTDSLNRVNRMECRPL